MKRIFLTLAAALLLPAAALAADDLELGVIAGEPTGISGKVGLKDGTALDFAAAWSFSGKDELSLHADKLWFKHDYFKPKRGRMPLYYGVGARLKLESKSLLGVRLPVGAQYYFKDSRLSFFGELAPILDLTPDTELRLSAAVGMRVALGPAK